MDAAHVSKPWKERKYQREGYARTRNGNKNRADVILQTLAESSIIIIHELTNQGIVLIVIRSWIAIWGHLGENYCAPLRRKKKNGYDLNDREP